MNLKLFEECLKNKLPSIEKAVRKYMKERTLLYFTKCVKPKRKIRRKK